jgi:glucose/arabinose dehydrogenase
MNPAPAFRRNPSVMGVARGALTAALVAACALGLSSAAAAGPPPNFIETTVATGLTRPTAMFWDNSARLWITEQGGTLRVIHKGELLPTPFVSLTVDATTERGLLGIAFDPSFGQNHYVYVYYTVPGTPAHNRVSRFTANGEVAVPGSEQVIFDLEPLGTAVTHNGGAIHFGRDGKLYIAVGDNEQHALARLLTSEFGKILRINPDGTIPTDNPFYAQATGNNRAIWALGFRNPYTFAFQPGSSRMFINDVGAHKWEEINDGIAGSNYGWPDSEGYTTNPAFRSPIYAYAHGLNDTPPCAIVGGTFYNPKNASFPAQYVGGYFFSDFCAGWIKILDPRNGNAISDFATTPSNVVDLQVGPDGSLYYLARNSRIVRRISYLGQPTLAQSQPTTGIASGGASVKLRGTYLAGATSVTFNGKPAPFTVVLDTWVRTSVPPGATTGKIAVTTPAGTAMTPNDFTVTQTVTGFSPPNGPAGTPVTISGQGFASVTAVTFNGRPASYSVVSPIEIDATVPAGATTGKILVRTTVGRTPSEASFVVP